MISIISLLVSGGALGWLGKIGLGYLLKDKTKAEADSITIGTASEVIDLVRTQLREMSVELKATKNELEETRRELRKTQASLLHMEMRLSKYEGDSNGAS